MIVDTNNDMNSILKKDIKNSKYDCGDS